MSVPPKSILVAGVDRRLLEQLAPALRRDELEIESVRSLSRAQAIAAERPQALILASCRDGLEDVGRLIEQIRSDGASTAAGVIVLCDHAGAEGLLDHGANRVLPLAAGDALERAVTELLTVAPRADLRVVVRLKLTLETKQRIVLAQTENLSVSGMLVRIPHAYPLGQQLSFRFGLPAERETVAGTAEIVRHTRPERERFSGVGTRFLDLEGNGHELLASCIERELIRSRVANG